MIFIFQPLKDQNMRSPCFAAILTAHLASAALAQPAREKRADWPGFLGPVGTSVSLEKGIIAPWPDKGLKIVWHKQLGTGYGMPSIRNDKLYLFDRHGDQARLSCLDA